MRTIASTFESRTEAEAVRRQLEGIGVSPDRIMLKGIFGAPDEGGGSGNILLSAKVEAEQVGIATEIMKGQPASGGAAQAEEPVLRSPAQIPAAVPPLREEATAPRVARGERMEPAAAPHIATTAAPATEAQPVRTRPVRPGDEAWRKLSRSLVVFGLLLVAAFVIGAMLGLAT